MRYYKYKIVWSSWTWIAFNVVGRIKSEESLVKTRPNYLVLAVWQTRLRKSCLVYTMKKRPFFWGRGQFAVYFGKFNRRLVTNGDGQMSPFTIPSLLHFLRRDLQFANICSSNMILVGDFFLVTFTIHQKISTLSK